MVLVAKPMFWGMRNHLGPFSEASHKPEGQELGGRAVGGQEGLQEVNFNLGSSNLASEHARDMVLVAKCFGIWGIIWDHFQNPQIDLEAKNWAEGM